MGVLQSLIVLSVYVLATQAHWPGPSPLGPAIAACIVLRVVWRWPFISDQLHDPVIRYGFLAISAGSVGTVLIANQPWLMGGCSAFFLVQAMMTLRSGDFRELQTKNMRGWWPEDLRERWMDIVAGVVALAGVSGSILAWHGDPALWLIFVTLGVNGLLVLANAIFLTIARNVYP